MMKHYINCLKVFLAMLVVWFHTSSGYGGAGGWYFIEPSNDEMSMSVLTLLNAIIQSFFMGLFFFISAYFSPKSYDRKGFYQFLKDRVPRLLLPALFYFFILNPLCVNMVRETKYTESLGFYNMWFIMALLYFTIIYALIRKAGLAKSVKAHFPGVKGLLVFILIMGTLNFATRLIFPTNIMYVHDFSLGYFPQYIVLFIAGIAAYRNGWLEQFNERVVNIYFRVSLVSIITLPVVFLLVGPDRVGKFYGGFTLESIYYSFWEPFTYVGIIMKLLVVFRKRLNRDSPVLGLLNRSSYSIYIIQAPFIIALQLALAGLEINIIIKVILVSLLAFMLSWGVSLLLLRIPRLNNIL
ncbi:acyltransferase family protein [Paenibacillus sp. YPG26]|uniref:acyltransferase family protein n=1 Tax=Paenibacillus sp. YPG26 TaxID=2878915 RepID=UPI0020404BDA|nr:acyltransferase family protein [Paenibacillus sp. YPG26]USB33659.1 acyltransferase family protein [Paenibacillus sp. YPG26]